MSTKFMGKIWIKPWAVSLYSVITPTILYTRIHIRKRQREYVSWTALGTYCIFLAVFFFAILCLLYLIAGTHLNMHTFTDTPTHTHAHIHTQSHLANGNLTTFSNIHFASTVSHESNDTSLAIRTNRRQNFCFYFSEKGQVRRMGSNIGLTYIDTYIYKNCNISFSSLSLQIVVIT